MEEDIDKFDLDFDTEKFIEEVKKRPVIWDCDSEEYSHRDIKKTAWNDVINIFGGPALSASQRRIMQITLRRKWKGLRGCFTRELRRQENLRAGVDPGARKSEYTHFKQLLFLHNVVTTKTTTSGNEEYEYSEELNVSNVKQENSIDEDYNEVNDESSEYNKLEILEEPSSEFSITGESNIECEERDPLRDIKRLKLKRPRKNVVAEDEDLLFLLSMLKTLQRVPFKKKMATKIKLMAVLDEATKGLEH